MASDYKPLTIDAIVDKEGNILGRHALFGLWGDLAHDQDNFCPFVLRSDGMIVYDVSYKTEERYFRFDLRDGKAVKGRLLKYISKLVPSNVVDNRVDNIITLPVAA